MRPYVIMEKGGFYVVMEGAFIVDMSDFTVAVFSAFVFGVLTTVSSELRSMERQEMGSRSRITGRGHMKLLLTMIGSGMALLCNYVAMLLVLTMNTWIISAVLVGHVAGFFISVTLFKRRSATGLVNLVTRKEGSEIVDFNCFGGVAEGGHDSEPLWKGE